MTASNTKTVTVAFFSIKRQPVDVSTIWSTFKAEAEHEHRSVHSFIAQGKENHILQVSIHKIHETKCNSVLFVVDFKQSTRAIFSRFFLLIVTMDTQFRIEIFFF